MFGTILGFFNPRRATQVVQAYNVVAAAGVAYNLATDPSASAAELLPDIAAHLSMLLLTVDDPRIHRLVALANVGRLYLIYQGVTEGTTHVPAFLNRVDVFNHLLNIVTAVPGMARCGLLMVCTWAEAMVDASEELIPTGLDEDHAANDADEAEEPAGSKAKMN